MSTDLGLLLQVIVKAKSVTLHMTTSALKRKGGGTQRIVQQIVCPKPVLVLVVKPGGRPNDADDVRPARPPQPTTTQQ